MPVREPPLTAPLGREVTARPRDVLLEKVIAWFTEHGVGDTSLRTLATGVGTSHRMLIYHFGSRDGLLGAVVEAVERSEHAALVELTASDRPPLEAGMVFWARVADRAEVFAPLFFELSTHAMRGEPHAQRLRAWLTTGWTDAIRAAYVAAGVPEERAATLALQSLAMARGLLFEVAVTGDRAAADAAMAQWTAMVLREVERASSVEPRAHGSTSGTTTSRRGAGGER